MTLPTLESVTDRLDERTVTLLGDPFTITPVGSAPAELMGFVDHGERTRDYGFTTVIVGERVVQIRKVDWPTRPKGETIHLSRLGEDFLPREVRTDESGRWWVVALKRKP